MRPDSMSAGNPFDVQEGIFIHHVPEKEMQATLLGKRKLEVPRGHIALVVRDGQVTEVLPAGVQVALGFWERALGEAGRKAFYVLSLRPVWLQSQPVALQDGQGRSVQYRANVYLTLPSLRDRAKLGQIIDRVLVEGEYVEIAHVRSSLSPVVEEAVRSSVVRQGAVVDVAASEKAILAKLQTQIGAFGFEISVNLTTGEQRLEVNVRMGTGPTPGLKPCNSCGTMLQETKKFCAKCGAQQPVSTNPSTSEVQAVAIAPESRLCVNHDCGALVLSTKKFCTKCGTPQPAVAAAAPIAAAVHERACVNASCGAMVLSTKNFCVKCGTRQPPVQASPLSAQTLVGTVTVEDPLITSDGEPLAADISLLVEGYVGAANDERIQRAVMAAVRPTLQRATSAVLGTREGLSALETVLHPDLERAVAAVGGRLISIGVLDVRLKNNDWVLQARSELDRAKKEVALDKEWHTLGVQEVEMLGFNYELARKRKNVETSHEVQELRAQLELEFQRADMQLADRERRTDLQDRGSDLNITDARRVSREALAVDAAKLELSRSRVTEGHVDALRDIGHEAQLGKAQRVAAQEADSDERQFAQQSERKQLEHEQTMERDVVAQDLKLRSDAVRGQAGDDSFVSRLQNDDEMYANSARQAFAEEVSDRALGRKHKDADLSQERELSAEDRRKKMRMEEMVSMAQMEAAIDSREKQHDIEKRRLDMDAEQARLNAAKDGVGTAAMLAVQMSGANAEAISAAIGKVADAEAAGGKDRAAAEAERARAAEIERNRERESAMQNAMMATMQQMMQQNAAFAQSMVQNQMQVTQSALGNASAAADRERDAMKAAANQAVSMSERSMGAIAQVATQASTHGPTVVMPMVSAMGAGGAGASTFVESQESMARPSAAGTSKSVAWQCRHCSTFNEPEYPRCDECQQPAP